MPDTVNVDIIETPDIVNVNIVEGNGDMMRSIYDPTLVGADAFDYNNLHTKAVADGVTITGDGSTGNPFISVGGGGSFDCADLIGCNVSNLTNDSGYITSAALSGYVPTSRNLTINGVTYDLSADRTWTIAASASLSGLTAATTSSTINNGLNPIEWQWNSLTSGTGLKLSSNSTSATTGNTVFYVTSSGTIANSQTTYGMKVTNSKSSSSGTNYGLNIAVSGSTQGFGLNIQNTTGNSTGINIEAGMGSGIQMNNNKLYFNSNTQYADASGDNLRLNSQNGYTLIRSGNKISLQFGDSQWNLSNTSAFVSTAANAYGLIWGGSYNGTNYTSLATTNNVIKSAAGTLTFCGNIGATAGGTFTPTDIMSVYGTNTNVGIGTTTPVASAALEISSTTKGFLPPRMTATQASAISSPAKGLILYSTDTNGTFTSAGLWMYNGTIWKLILAE